jgi:hypothetical protein
MVDPRPGCRWWPAGGPCQPGSGRGSRPRQPGVGVPPGRSGGGCLPPRRSTGAGDTLGGRAWRHRDRLNPARLGTASSGRESGIGSTPRRPSCHRMAREPRWALGLATRHPGQRGSGPGGLGHGPG